MEGNGKREPRKKNVMTLFKAASLEISIGKKRVVSATARGNLKRRPSFFSINRRGLNGLGGNPCQMCTAGHKDGVGTNVWVLECLG